ncbi:hypothetical protein GQ53DRAFT_725227 [Thozetella sp. PMI_491]|nr:hypothetical protein GQ53DRAFT_725227 [Thozetella sp. PMI_491]
MSSDATLSIKKRKQRVDVACDFCRLRKLGCDNAKPKCENCYSHQKECTYAVRIHSERPSNSRMKQLLEENSRLRKIAEDLTSSKGVKRKRAQNADHQIASASPSNQARNPSEPDLSQERITSASTALAPASTAPLSSEKISAESRSVQFHGPTSAMFDGQASHERRQPASRAIAMGGASDKTQLLAEAARQRQLELVNLRVGKLNFDGTDPEVGMDLLSVFWNRQHATGSVVYRPCFMRDMASQGPYFSELLLNAIFFVASKHSPALERTKGPAEVCETGHVFRSKIESILYRPNTQILCKSNITTVQALLLLSDALFSWCDERSLAWHFLGVATSMIIDLGIHSESPRLGSEATASLEDVETRRRVYWAAFILDKTQSIYQGRPARLRDMDSSVPIVFMDEFEELEPFGTAGYSASPVGLGYPTHSVTTFEQLCKLSIIADHILCNFYAEKTPSVDPEDLFRTSRSLQQDLNRWCEDLPVHLSIHFDGSRGMQIKGSSVALPHTLCLMLMHHALLILLHRPFLSEGHLKAIPNLDANHAFSICESAALEIDAMLQWYQKQWCIKSPPYFLSYATYVGATIHVRNAARRPRGSTAHLCLQRCLGILHEHQNLCNAPRRALAILLGLIERLKVEVGDSVRASSFQPCEGTPLAERKNAPSRVPEPIFPNTVSPNPPGAPSLSRDRTETSNILRMHAGDPMLHSEDRAGLDKQSGTHENHILQEQTTSPSQSMGNGWDGGFPELSFDFDPLYGFDIFQTGLDWGYEGRRDEAFELKK